MDSSAATNLVLPGMVSGGLLKPWATPPARLPSASILGSRRNGATLDRPHHTDRQGLSAAPRIRRQLNEHYAGPREPERTRAALQPQMRMPSTEAGSVMEAMKRYGFAFRYRMILRRMSASGCL